MGGDTRYDLAACRMNEKDGFALIQLVKNGVQRFIPHIDAIGIGKQTKSDGAESVKCVVNLSQRVWDTGKGERS